MHKISDIFYENIYHIFVEYCGENHLVYMKDLETFDFDALKDVKGIGVSKIRSIQQKFNHYKNHRTDEDIFSSIHPENLPLSVESLTLFDISRNVVDSFIKSNILTILDLANYGNSNLYKNNLNVYKKILKAIKNYQDPISKKIPIILSAFAAEDHHEVIMKRAMGVTLSKIGEELKVTRERVRQIESAKLKKLKVILDVVLKDLEIRYHHRSCINLNRLEGYFKNKEDALVMKYTVHVMYKDYYLDFCNKLLINGETKEAVLDRLNGITDYYIKDIVNFASKMVVITESLAKNNIPYIDVEDLTNYLLLNGYIKKGSYIYKAGISYGLLCTIVIKNYFKDGIKIHDEKDLNKLRKIVSKEFEGLELPDNNRALGTRISFFLVLCDRGRYTVSSNIKIGSDLLNEIYDYINRFPGSTLFFNDIFVRFQDALLNQSNVVNRYYLQGVLKFYFEDDFIFERDSLTKKGHVRKNIRELISEFILEKKRPVHRREIKQFFPGATDVVITNAQISNHHLLQWEYNYYIHSDNLNCTARDRAALKALLTELFSEFQGYCSEQLLFDTAMSKKLPFLQNNFIRNASNLFYLAAYLFQQDYEFRRPHILRDKIGENELSSRVVVEKFLFKNHILKYSDYQDFVSKIKWSIGTTYAVFKDLEKDIVRISEDEYVSKVQFQLSAQEQKQIFDFLREQVKEYEYIPVNKFTKYQELPPLQFEWNPYLLSSVIQLYEPENLKVIAPQVEDRRYVKEILVDPSLNIDSYESLIIYVIQKNKLSASTLYHLETVLSAKGLIGRYLPKELYNSKNIYIEEDKFYTI